MATIEAAQAGLIQPILVGPAATLKPFARHLKIDLEPHELVVVPHSHAAAAKAVELVCSGKADILMKGSLHSDEFLGAIVARETGLRTGRRLSHVFVMDVPTYHKVFIITDAAINIATDLEAKADIVQNAIDLAIVLGVKQPKVGILSALETVTSKIPSTLDAAALCKMADRGQIRGGPLDGPLAFDNAISKQAARSKRDRVRSGRRRRYPAGARPRCRQHAGQATELSRQRRQRRPGARCTRAGGADQPCRRGAHGGYAARKDLRGEGAMSLT